MNTNESRLISIVHLTVDLDVAYDRFIQHFENILGRFDPAIASTFAHEPQLADERLKQMEGEQSLMVFFSQNHGGLFLLLGQQRKAMRYTLGNPRIAIQMTRHDIGAGLYVPLTILVHETDQKSTRIVFDKPSSLLNQFAIPEISEIAKELDLKLEKVIEKAAQLSRQ